MGPTTALQYWCAKWHGSQELADEFARQATAAAPPQALFSRLPMVSWYEHHDIGEAGGDPTSPVLTALVAAGLAEASAATEDGAALRELRHLLAHYLARQGRYSEAVQQLRAVDGMIRALPWSYYGDGAAEHYTRFRDRTFASAAQQAPRV